MKLPTFSGPYFCFFLLILICSISNAHENDDKSSAIEKGIGVLGVTHETYVACVNEFANKKLDPIRSKIPFWLLNGATDAMQKNFNIPTKEEKIALKAYLNASITCDTLTTADILKNDEKKQHETNLRKVESLKEELQPLIDGKITYAEYLRRQDKKGEKALKSMGFDPNEFTQKPIDPKRYQNFVESWLGQYKANYPANSPWWTLYYYAIGIAKDVDKGKMSDENAAKLIEEKRLKVNQEMAALTAPKVVNLNCSVTSSGGSQNEIALTIDYTNMQVNGFKAEFYENEIRWTVPDPVNPDSHFTLNRLSGFVSGGTYQSSNLVTGHCTQATRQF